MEFQEFKVGDFVTDLNGAVTKIIDIKILPQREKGVHFLLQHLNINVYYKNHYMPAVLFRHSTPEEIAAVIAEKMLE